jgi:hypothetical protein
MDELFVELNNLAGNEKLIIHYLEQNVKINLIYNY